MGPRAAVGGIGARRRCGAAWLVAGAAFAACGPADRAPAPVAVAATPAGAIDLGPHVAVPPPAMDATATTSSGDAPHATAAPELRLVFAAKSPQGALSLAAWSPTGWRLATATANSMPMNPKEHHSRDFTLRVWDPTEASHPAPLTMDATEGFQWPYVGWCEFVDHEHVLSTVRGWAGDPARRVVTLWHVGKGAAVRRQSFDGSAITACALDRARGRLWVGTEGGAVYAADPLLASAPRPVIAGAGPTGHLEVNHGVCALAFEAASGVVAVATTEGAVWRVDPAGATTVLGAPATPEQWTLDVRVRAGSGWLASVSEGRARAWPGTDAAARRMAMLARQLAAQAVERVDDVAPLPDDAVVVAARIAGAPALLHARADGSPPRALRLPIAASAAIEALDASADGRWLAVACSDGRTHAFDLARAEVAPVATSARHAARCRSVRVRTGLGATPAFVAVCRDDRLLVFAIDG